MLVLTRKSQDQIRIGDNITLTILRVKGNTVRIGIQAPRDVHVIRGELTVELTAEAADMEAQPSAAASQEEALESAPSLRRDRWSRCEAHDEPQRALSAVQAASSHHSCAP